MSSPDWSQGVRSGRMRTLATLVSVFALVAGCGGSTATTSPAGRSPSASASLEMPPSPTAPAAASASMETPPSSETARPTATSTITSRPVAWHWATAGTMAIGRVAPHAVLLTDGRVLVIGNETWSVRDDSATAELWNPATGTWQMTASLNRPRADFAAVALPDGRALVTGGLDRGAPAAGSSPDTACYGSGQQQSYSSTYLWDPRQAGWIRAGLLGTARTAPAAAVLADGRVLVAGGYYRSGSSARTEAAPEAALAAYDPASATDIALSRGPLADVGPNFIVPPLATAELFDPATGSWSSTGPLTYARYGAAAVTLTDGRVLVVGSDAGAWVSGGGAVEAGARAYDNAEIYDPKTGRFSLTGDLPPIDQSALRKVGITFELGSGEPEANGALVPLADGGALLVGNARYWKHEGDVSRSFRFDARTGRWTEVGQTFVSMFDPGTGERWESPGVSRLDALVARLSDGRVLVAGGNNLSTKSQTITRSAELYDPATNTWTPLPPMPGPRAGGAAVALPDGSVLLVGGYDRQSMLQAACDQPIGLTSAIRFVPSP